MANIFPKWANKLPKMIIIAAIIVVTALTIAMTAFLTPKYSNVGYQPIQPVPFDHYLHVGQLGMDCRYCHTYVDRSPHSNVPSASTCMNCHNQVKTDSPLLAPIRESYDSGMPVNWVRIHDTPDYVYFNHTVHINRGVSCVECHGKINEMPVVFQSKSLTMQFCLDCHRKPELKVRPLDKVFDLNWKAESPKAQLEMGKKFVHDWKINPPVSCSGCHR